MRLRLKRGAKYVLHRRASAPLDLTFVSGQPRSDSKTWLLFRLSKRAAARRGKATAPQLIRKEFYEVERSNGRRKQVKLVEQFVAVDGRYLLFSSIPLKLKPHSPKVRREG